MTRPTDVLPQNDAEPPMSPRQFGARVGLTDQTIRSMVRRGDLEAFVLNGRFKIPARLTG